MNEFEKFVLKCRLTGIEVNYTESPFGYVVQNVSGNFVKEFKLPEGVVSIGVYCFKDFSCETLILPSTCKTIGDNCCYTMHSLTEVICDTVNIHNYAFFGCSNLKKFRANSILRLGKSCFDSCTSLSMFDFKNVICDIIGDCAFNDCYSLKNLSNFNELSSVILGDLCFNNCVSLEHVNLPDNVVLRDRCFSKCIGLRSITLKDFDSIGVAILDGCLNYIIVNIPEKYKSLDLRLLLSGDSKLDLSKNVRFY